MKRREIVAGVGSLGVVAGGGWLYRTGPPSFDVGTEQSPDGGEGEDEDENAGEEGPATIETIDAPGSQAGTVAVPDPDRISFVQFILTSCGNCQSQVPVIVEARERLDGEPVRFVTVTYESIGGQIEAGELAAWWDDHGGTWPVGYDPSATLTARYNVAGYPVTIVLGRDGEAHWRDTGLNSASTFVDEIERALDAEGLATDSNADSGTDNTGPGTDNTGPDTDDTGSEAETGTATTDTTFEPEP